MRTRWIRRPLVYDGAQLRAHWILRTTGIAGDALVAFRGPCRVSGDEMADLHDLLHGPGIAADDMLHFLAEVFDDGELVRAVLRQRLVTAIALESLRALASSTRGAALRREGDDLWLGQGKRAGKLSVSIATRSPVSTLLHLGVNVTNAGAPVRTASLTDLGVEPAAFARDVMARVAAEHASLHAARVKVRAKGEVRHELVPRRSAVALARATGRRARRQGAGGGAE